MLYLVARKPYDYRNMKQLMKIIYIILIFNILQLYSSCLSCPDNGIPVDVNGISIQNINNVGEYLGILDGTTMNAAAVAFELGLILDDSFYAARTKRGGFGIASAYAEECPRWYETKSSIVDVRIVTLLDLSTEVAAGTDVTDLFVAEHHYDSSGLYISIETAIQQNLGDNLEQDYYSDYTSFRILRIFSTYELQVSTAQFEISIEFEDGQVLKENTELLTII